MTKNMVQRFLIMIGSFLAIIGACGQLYNEPSSDLTLVLGLVIGSNAVLFCQSLVYIAVMTIAEA